MNDLLRQEKVYLIIIFCFQNFTLVALYFVSYKIVSGNLWKGVLKFYRMTQRMSTLLFFLLMLHLQPVLGEKPFVIGLLSKCESKGDQRNSMGMLLSQRLRVFSSKMLRRYFNYHEFDVCEDSGKLVSSLSSMLVDGRFSDKQNRTRVANVVTFIPESLLKLTFSILSFTRIKIWPLQIVSDMKFFEKSPQFLPIYELLPEDFISRLIFRQFKWDNIHIVEVLLHRGQPPKLSMERLWKQVSGSKCVSYTKVSIRQLRNPRNIKVKKILDALKKDRNGPVVFVVGHMAAMFMHHAHNYGVNKYWILFAKYTNAKNGTVSADFISILNSVTKDQTIKIPFSSDTICNPQYIAFQKHEDREPLCQHQGRGGGSEASYSYTFEQFKKAQSLVPIRLLDIIKNVKQINYYRPDIAQLVNGKTVKLDSINSIVETSSILAVSRLSRCTICKDCGAQKCNKTSIRQVNGGGFDKRFAYACEKCRKQYILTKNGKCKPCPGQMLPNLNHSACYNPVKNVKKYSACYILTIIGIIVSIITMAICTKYRHTPVVKSSNFPLSIIQLVSCTLCYVAFLMFYHEERTDFICTVGPVVISTLLVSIVALVVCKAEKILIVFFKKTRLSKKDIKDILIRQLFIFAFLLIVNFILIPASSRLPATVVSIPYPEEDGLQYYVLGCSSDRQFDIQLIYGVVILLLAMAQGYRGRKLPTNYNEGVSIVVASATTACSFLFGIWALNSSSTRHNRMEVVWIALCVGLIFMVVSLYGPKIYIILFQASKNTKIYHLHMMLVDSRKQVDKMTLIPRKRSRADSIQVKLELMISRDSF